MTTDINLEVLLDTNPADAFHAWVDPLARKVWYAPEAGWVVTDAGTDLRVGGAWHVAFGPSGDEPYRESGTFREVDRPQRVVYTSRLVHPDGRVDPEEVDIVTFDERGGRTLLTVHASGHADDDASNDHHENGWRAFLRSFTHYLATTGGLGGGSGHGMRPRQHQTPAL